MACAGCCHCHHEPPPDGTKPGQVRLVADLARIAGTTPFYSKGKYRPLAYATGSNRSLNTPAGSTVKAEVWRDAVTFDDSNRMVSLDACLTPEDAVAVFEVLWKAKKAKKRRTTRKPKKLVRAAR